MLFKRIWLKNIRSYREQEIVFPNGIVLLSGDIGSGKSTILLAAEFALFGLLKGELSGSALLRNGANEGVVELMFELDGVDYTVSRTLRRSKNGVKQDSGFLEVNGVKSRLTPMELKSRVLGLLGYSAELLTKSKSLIYRYTVYTPQEDMKRILLEDHEDRLKILRSVFDIEKYQKIKDNAVMYGKNLRERIRHFEGYLVDLEEKKHRKRLEERELEAVQHQLSKIVPALDIAKKKVVAARINLRDLEETKREFEELVRDVQVSTAKQEALLQNIARMNGEVKELADRSKVLGSELAPMADVEGDLRVKNEEMGKIEQELFGLHAKNAEFGVKRRQAQELAMKISDLSTCPTCFQEVNDHHKSKIVAEQKQTLRLLYDDELSVQQRSKAAQERLALVKNELNVLRQREKEIEVQKIKRQHLKDLNMKLAETRQKIGVLEAEGALLQKIVAEKVAKRAGLEPRLKDHRSVQAEFDQALKVEKDLAVEHARLSQTVEHMERQLGVLADEINRKELAKLKLEKITETHAWLDDKFVPLMGEIERHVMVKIQEEFNATFKNWFGMLIEDSLMTAELDETFTPVINQNGFDTDTSFLSGGEKTACALAYRLALNRTINSLLNTIKTKDVLILDEPTDGFSDEQLDKMRDVIEDLGLRQIILVSHEQKIESFAEHVIRIEKQDHVSSIR